LAQFGLVFFAASVLIAICLCLGDRNEGEMSAYSVFNPNCERLLGQITAEHFERDVLRRRID
uniref:SAYSvFN domain-containing protein n=1 Tax=Angiostrongylus cantonensis TaxID=6313 RepID=A0A0K0CVT0_ANGCA